MRDIIERCVAAVKRELTANKRDDIARELEANTVDKVEALETEYGSLSKEQLSKLLIDMGNHWIDRLDSRSQGKKQRC